MDKIIFNSLLKSTGNNHLWFNILSAKKESYSKKNDYLIEYILVFENGNGEKVKNKNFVYHAHLSDFANKEQNFIKQLIKLRECIKVSASTDTVMVEVTVI